MIDSNGATHLTLRRSSPQPRVRRLAGFGWVPDLPDPRDVRYVPHAPGVRSVDLRAKCPRVRSQESLASATALAIAGALAFTRRADRSPSPLFLYYNQRVIANNVYADDGAQLRDGLKSVAQRGICREASWPYVAPLFAARPPQECYAEAHSRAPLHYARLEHRDLDELRACLAEGYPFVLGFVAYERFAGREVATSGRLDMPRPGELPIAGHAALAVGYDDAIGRFIVRNSWGSDWGLAGYFTMPYAYAIDPGLTGDCWTIR